MSLAAVHEWWGWLIVVANGLVGCWCLAAQRVTAARGRLLWIAVAVAEVAIVVQVVIGVVLVADRDTDAWRLHMFYGFVAMLTVGLVYSYRHQLRDHLFLLYGGGSLFLMGLALRAITLTPASG